jgi:small-conductance mechanosensitive channel
MRMYSNNLSRKTSRDTLSRSKPMYRPRFLHSTVDRTQLDLWIYMQYVCLGFNFKTFVYTKFYIPIVELLRLNISASLHRVVGIFLQATQKMTENKMYYIDFLSSHFLSFFINRTIKLQFTHVFDQITYSLCHKIIIIIIFLVSFIFLFLLILSYSHLFFLLLLFIIF